MLHIKFNYLWQLYVRDLKSCSSNNAFYMINPVLIITDGYNVHS